MIISNKAHIDILKIFITKKKLSHNSCWSNGIFVKNGKEALSLGLQILNLKKKKIAIPALICSSVTDTISELGHENIFIDINENIQMCSEKCTEMMKEKKIDGILLVDYFGINYEENLVLAKKIKNLGGIVILDKCQSFLINKDPQDELKYADIIIYSLRKIFPIKDGGVLFISKNRNKIHQIKKKNIIFDLDFLIISLLEKFIFMIINYKIFIFLKNQLLKFKRYKFHKFVTSKDKKNIKSNLVSALLYHQLFNKNYFIKFLKKRNHNYEKIIAVLKKNGFKLLRSHKNYYSSPQSIPIIDTSGKLLKYLLDNDIIGYNWPGKEIPDYVMNNRELYPTATLNNDQIVLIPTHQSLNDLQLKKIETTINSWNINKID